MDIRTKIYEIAMKNTKKEEIDMDELTDVNMIELLEFDSLATMQFLVDLEEAFHLDFSDNIEIFMILDNFEALAAYITELIEGV